MRILNSLLILFCALTLSAQLPDWSMAPDFTLPDTEGSDHTLYDYLDDGYSVILDFSATWCGPCWNYHQGGTLEAIYDDYGPGGEDKVMVFMIEADPGTSLPCIYGPAGCSGGSIGDWTAGVSYPILNPPAPEAAAVNASYQINYYPTLYGVAPNGDVLEIGQASYNGWESWVAESFQMHNTSWDANDESCTSSFIDLHPEGGFGPIQFEWSNGATTEDLNNIDPGTYYVTLTDDHDYEVEIGPIEVIGSAAEINLLDIGHIDCNGQIGGFIEIEVESINDDFSYEWSNGETTQNIYDLEAGDYEVIVTDNETGCEFEMDYEVEEPDQLEYYAEVMNPDCGGGFLGSIEFDVDGGTWPITFVFEDFDTQNDYISLEPGEYIVTIVDYNDCHIVTEQFTIEEVMTPDSDASALGMFNCSTDTVYVSVDSSSVGPNISYAWFDPSMTYISGDTLLAVDSSGIYTLEVTDLNSECTTVSSVLVMEDFSSPEAMTSALTELDCNNSVATLTSEGSTADSSIVYMWSSPDGTIMSDPTQMEIQVGAEGTYELTVTNIVSGCQSVSSLQLMSADLPDIYLEGATDFCEGSSTTICVDHTADEEASWYLDNTLLQTSTCFTVSEEVDLEIRLMNINTGCESAEMLSLTSNELPETIVEGETSICEGSTTTLCLENDPDHEVSWRQNGQEISNAYCIDINETTELELYVTNSLTGCSSEDIVSVSAYALPELTVYGDYSFCEGTSATICTDNDPDYELSWRLNGTELSSLNCLTVDFEGEYELVITDPMTGCNSVEYTMIEVLDVPTLTGNTSGLLDCNNSSVDLELQIEGDYESLVWMNESGDVVGYTPIISVETAGNYNAQVITELGCMVEIILNVEHNPDDLPSSDFSFISNDYEFEFTSQITGELDEIHWDFGDGNSSTDENPSHSYSMPGYYTVVLTVSNDCGSVSTSYEVLATTTMQLTSIIRDISCNGQADGGVSIVVYGGVPPYTYSWNDNSFTGSELTDLNPGVYSLQITDSVGALIETEVEINEPDPIVVNSNIVNSPAGENIGSIELDVTGGNGSYSYIWNNGSTEMNLYDLARGDYSVIITDEKGCTTEEFFTISGTTSILDSDLVKKFLISPNPAIDEFEILLELKTHERLMINVYSMTGQLMTTNTVINSTSKLKLDVSDWTSGVYFIELKSDTGSIVKKLIISE